jgi:hypothetical protein
MPIRTSISIRTNTYTKKALIPIHIPVPSPTPKTQSIQLSPGENLHGRRVYRHENGSQFIFYVYGEFDGWLLGPNPGKLESEIIIVTITTPIMA